MPSRKVSFKITLFYCQHPRIIFQFEAADIVRPDLRSELWREPHRPSDRSLPLILLTRFTQHHL